MAILLPGAENKKEDCFIITAGLNQRAVRAPKEGNRRVTGMYGTHPDLFHGIIPARYVLRGDPVDGRRDRILTGIRKYPFRLRYKSTGRGNMVQHVFGQPEKPVPAPDPEKIRRIVVIVIALVAISVITFMLAGEPSSAGAAAPEKARSASGGSSVHATATAAVTAAAEKPVDFILAPGEPISCGLTCRELTAAITNTGYSDAHNVCISLSMHNSKGEVIALNGGETLRTCIGDLGPGERRSEPVTINADCGMFALKCVKETLTLETVVSSDETTVAFPAAQLAV